MEDLKEVVKAHLQPHVAGWANELKARGVIVDTNATLDFIAQRAINAFVELDRSLAKKVEEAEKRLYQAQKDLERAKEEQRLRTTDPRKFVVETAESIARMVLVSSGSVSVKQGKAMDGTTSRILKRTVKKYVQ